MSKIDDRLLDMGENYYPEHEYPSSYRDQNIKAIQEAKQAILTDLLVLPIAQDEPMPENLSDYTDDDQRKYWYNKCRKEFRQALTAYFEGVEK